MVKTLQQFFGVASLKEPYRGENSINLEQLLKSLLRQSEPDMVRFASTEALDCMLAYYKVIHSAHCLASHISNKKQVALKRFVDDIANEVVESRLMCSLSHILSPVTAFNMPPNIIMKIAGESKESQTTREQLSKELRILNQGSETCKRFVKAKAAGGTSAESQSAVSCFCFFYIY